MGLDIVVDVFVEELRDDLEFHSCPIQRHEGIRILEGMERETTIHTRPGSYAGLHVVRTEYAKLKGFPLGADGRYLCEGDALKSHLINHCDAQWYYLPVDFPDPQWIPSAKEYAISVGSSHRLLAELWELYAVRDKWPVGFSDRWDAVFLPALASVVTGKMIEFT